MRSYAAGEKKPLSHYVQDYAATLVFWAVKVIIALVLGFIGIALMANTLKYIFGR